MENTKCLQENVEENEIVQVLVEVTNRNPFSVNYNIILIQFMTGACLRISMKCTGAKINKHNKKRKETPVALART